MKSKVLLDRILKTVQRPPPDLVSVLIAAHVYMRYSTNKQDPRSIADQFLQSQKYAASAGAHIPNDDRHIFKDEAVPGKALGKKRPGWFALKQLIKEGYVRVLVCDEFSRLFRHNREATEIMHYVKQHKIIVISSNLDTRRDDWEQTWLLNMFLSQNEIKSTIRRISRTAEGIVSRGTAATHLPYGYTRKVHYRATGEKDHTEILIDPVTSLIVRRIFAERKEGRALGAIAQGLNADKIPLASAGCRTPRTDKEFPLWVPGSVQHVLSRNLYRGILQFGQFSSSQPHLALVAPADWELVQAKTRGISRSGRGGGVHWASGLLSCMCGSTMTVARKEDLRGGRREKVRHDIVCGRCHQEAQARITKPAPPTSVPVVQALIEGGMSILLTDATIEAYRSEVASLGRQTNEAQIIDARNRLAAIEQTIKNFTAIIGKYGSDGLEAMENALGHALNEKSAIRLELRRLSDGEDAITDAEVTQQLDCDPRLLVKRLFKRGNVEPAALRAILCRIFPRIVLERKSKPMHPYRAQRKFKDRPMASLCRTASQAKGVEARLLVYETFFLVTLDVGMLFACETDTPALKLSRPTFRIKVSHKRLSRDYTVEVVDWGLAEQQFGVVSTSARGRTRYENRRLERLGIAMDDEDEFEKDEDAVTS
jgi:DNA invertase Pin-like site-specific DNA recombinase